MHITAVTFFQAKSRAVKELYSSAKRVVEDELLELPEAITAEQMPNPENIARAVNHHRQRIRPTHPTDLDFDVCIVRLVCYVSDITIFVLQHQSRLTTEYFQLPTINNPYFFAVVFSTCHNRIYIYLVARVSFAREILLW